MLSMSVHIWEIVLVIGAYFSFKWAGRLILVYAVKRFIDRKKEEVLPSE